MRYIDTLRDGEQIQEIYLCKSRQTALTKGGKPYENVVLQDKTGILDAKIWNPNDSGIREFDNLDYVELTGNVTLFMGKIQLSIRSTRKVDEGEYDPSDYLPVSQRTV